MFQTIYSKVAALVLIAFLVGCKPPPPTEKNANLTPYMKPEDPNACPINNAGATFAYNTPMQVDFVGDLKASGLVPNHWYAFSLNGWNNAQGNDLIADSCQKTPKGEGFCDFTFQADNAGEINESISRTLPIGTYAIKFLLKDAETTNSCVVLYNDNPPHFMITK